MSEAVAEASLQVLPAPTFGTIRSMSDDGGVVVGSHYLLTPAGGGPTSELINLELGELIVGVSGDGTAIATRDAATGWGNVRAVDTLSQIGSTLPSYTDLIISNDGMRAIYNVEDEYPYYSYALRAELPAGGGSFDLLVIPTPAEDPGTTSSPFVTAMSGDANVVLASITGRPMVWTPAGGSHLISPELGLQSGGGAVSRNGRHITMPALTPGAPGGQIDLYLSTDGGTPLLLDSASDLTVSDVTNDATRILGTKDGSHGVWEDGGTFRDLATLLLAAGIDLGTFDQDLEGLDMSPDGGLILGSGSDGTTRQYWIADIGAIPEPATGLLVGLGLAAMARRSRGLRRAEVASR